MLLYVDDTVSDATSFGDVRSRAYKIMPKEDLQATGQRLSTKPISKLALRWQAVDGVAARMRRHLRPLCETLELSGTEAASPWLSGLDWMAGVFERQQRLAQRPLSECPEAPLPERLKPYLLTFDAKGNPTGVHADRYEFWIYRQLRKRLKSGEVYVDDSQQHQHLSAELVPQDKQAEALQQLDIPWVREPLDARLAALSTELREQWLAFDGELRAGQLKHLDYDATAETLTWHQPKARQPTTASATPSPSCRFFRTTRSTSARCTAPSTGRSSACSAPRSRRGTRASISAAARAWSPTRCCAITCRCRAG